MAVYHPNVPHHHIFPSYFRHSRVPLSLLFFLLVALSVVLTLVSINESLRVRSMLGIITSDALRRNHASNPSISVPHQGAMATANILVLNVSSSLSHPIAVAINDSTELLNPHHHVVDSKRRSGIERLKKFKKKLLLLKGGLFYGNLLSNSAKPGWKLLPGNVVVPDGDVANPHNYVYITNAVEACAGMTSSLRGDGRIGLLIFVESDVRNADRRQVIRQTWGLPLLQKALNYRVVFMLGLARSRETQEVVNQEFYAYGDVVQENFTESFRHLTLKSIMGLKWALQHCNERSADYIMKTDDDILVHVPNLMRLLQIEIQDRKSTSSILCHKNRSRQIVRRGPQMVKYQVSPRELPGSYFPDYCGGFAYVMRTEVAKALYEASTGIPYFFIEDVYITGFCRHRAGIRLVDHPDIMLRPHVTVDQAPCHFSEGRVTSQELSSEEMKSIWQTLNTRGFFCPVLIAATTISNNSFTAGLE